MKFQMDSVELQSSGTLSEAQFGVSDMGFILHLLRSKIYSDIKKAICQEYTCNARDAHREAGKDNVPIEITLPTYLESNFRVRDFGNSISPENMVKVFIQYGSSTKRNSNNFTGGFGIGCKTAFGYTDAFIVNTFIDGIHRSYSCVIDDTRCGKLVLLSEEVTIEPNGTEIVVPVDATDITTFARETQKACRHWDLKPIIHGGIVEWNDFNSSNILLEGTNWFVIRSNSGSRTVKFVVDGVEYPSNLEALGISNNLPFRYSTILYLKFPIGVLSVSANREQIENDNISKKAIQEQLDVVKTELNQCFEDTIKNCKTFLEANLSMLRIMNNLNIDRLDSPNWNGYKLYGQAVNLSSAHIATYSREPNGTTIKVIKIAGPTTNFQFMEKTVYCLTEKDFQKSLEVGVLAVFKAFPDAENVCMIRFDNANGAKEFEDKNLNLLSLVNLSDYYVPKAKNPSLGRLIFYKLDKSDKFVRSSLKEYEADTNKKYWCSLVKDKQYSRAANFLMIKIGQHPNYVNKDLTSLVYHILGSDVSVYGFSTETPQDRLKEATEEMENFEHAVNEYIKNESIDVGEVKFAFDCAKYSGSSEFLFNINEEKEFQKNLSKFKNQNSKFVDYLKKTSEIQAKIEKLCKFRFLLFNLDSIVEKNFVEGIKELKGSVVSNYPLLKHMTYQRKHAFSSLSRDMTPASADLIDYINMVDLASAVV